MIIGLAGYAGVGKDTAGDILIQKYDYRRVGFADKIKSMLYDINPQVGSLDVQTLVNEQGWSGAKAIPEVRRLLQELGVAGRTFLGEDIWIWEALGEAVYVEQNQNADGGVEKITQKIVVTDVRFENEAKFIRDFGGQIWQVVKDGVRPVNEHISETDLIGFDFDKIITNNGSKEDLEKQIEEILNEIEKK